MRLLLEPVVIQVSRGHDPSLTHSKCKQGTPPVSPTDKSESQWDDVLTGPGSRDWMRVLMLIVPLSR